MVEIVPGPALSRHILRGRPVGGVPLEPCRATVTGDRAALWLGPDEWLLLAPAGTPVAPDGADSLVDVSQRQLALIVTGPDAAEVLNGAVPLDLGLAAFPVGMCTRTICEKAEIVLWRTAPERFHIEAWRSFMPYVRDLLHAAARAVG
jgi:sarcosine oxidase subunit gamma